MSLLLLIKKHTRSSLYKEREKKKSLATLERKKKKMRASQFSRIEDDLESQAVNDPPRRGGPLRRTNSYTPPRVSSDSPPGVNSVPPRRANSNPPRHTNSDLLGTASANLFSKLVTFFCCLGVPSPSNGDSASPTHSANMFSTLGSFIRHGTPLLGDADATLLGGRGGVPPPDTILADEAWGEFVKEANSFIQWILSTVFLFILAKLIASFAKLLVAMWSEEPVPFTLITDLLSQVEKSYFPRIFLPLVLLYAGFYMGAHAFRKKNLKFCFEFMSLVIGFVATLVLLFYLDAEGWIYTFGALVGFFLVFVIFKLWDYYN